MTLITQIIIIIIIIDILEFTCTGRPDGNYADPNDCSKYISCNGGVLFSRSCSPGLYWNQAVGICDWPANVQCSGGSVSTAPPTDTTVVPTTADGTTSTDGITSTGQTGTTTSNTSGIPNVE